MVNIDRRTFLIGGAALGASILTGIPLTGCANPATTGPTSPSDAATTDTPSASVSPTPSPTPTPTPTGDGKPQVFFTKDISPAGLLAIYAALGVTPQGKVAVKISTGEPGGNNYLHPELIKDLVQKMNGTIVECCTAYGGRRADPKNHYQVAVDHGFTAIADVEILDAKGELELPVTGGVRLDKVPVGASFSNYDFYLALSHFKGHPSAGFGGAIKNIAIGLASAKGKSLIHRGGNLGGGSTQEAFLEAMAETVKGVADRLGPNITHINVMNRLSVDCDCLSNPAAPAMEDIGVLGCADPVALDQACVDLVYAAKDGQALIQRMESRQGIHVLEHAEAIGLGSREYHLVAID